MRDLIYDKYFIICIIVVTCCFIFFKKYNIVYNYTHSLPQRIFVVDVNDNKLTKGDYLAFYSRNLPNISNNHTILKMIAGVGGESVEIKNGEVLINNSPVVKVSNKKAYWGYIHPITPRIIPNSCYFVIGKSETSFDSRYKEFGLVCKEQIIGKAYPFF